MVTGKDYNGSSVDIWSSGIVLYTMVCGYLPFEDENQNLLFSKIAKGLFFRRCGRNQKENGRRCQSRKSQIKLYSRTPYRPDREFCL